MKKLALVLVVALLAPAPAAADIIDVTFTGFATGIRPCSNEGPHICPNGDAFNLQPFRDKPFTAEFIFDTALGTLIHNPDGSNRLDLGLVNASMDLGDLGTWGIPASFRGGFDFLAWQDDLSSVTANAGFSQFHLFIPGPGAPGAVSGRHVSIWTLPNHPGRAMRCTRCRDRYHDHYPLRGSTWSHRWRRTSRPDLGQWRSSRLVAAASEDRLNCSAPPHTSRGAARDCRTRFMAEHGMGMPYDAERVGQLRSMLRRGAQEETVRRA